MEERLPELKLYQQDRDLLTLKDWGPCQFSLSHKVQIEPSFAAKTVMLTWTIQNFEAWRGGQPDNHIEGLPEKRVTFLDQEFILECHLRLGQDFAGRNTEKAFLVSKSDGLAILRGDTNKSYLRVFRMNSASADCGSIQRQGDDVEVRFDITLVKFLDLDNESRLQRDLGGLLEGNKFTDFKVRCGQEEFPCHRGILASRSPTFAHIFAMNPGADQLEIKDFLPAKVKQMLQFIYSQTVTGDADLELLKLANEFKIKGLIKLCGRNLARTLTPENALDLLDEAYKHPDGTLKNLRDSVLDFCSENYRELKKTDRWKQREPNNRREDDIFNFFFTTHEKLHSDDD